VNDSISDWLFCREKIAPSKEVNDLLHPRVHTYTEVGSNYQSSTGSEKPSSPMDYRIVTPVIVAFDVSFVFRLRFSPSCSTPTSSTIYPLARTRSLDRRCVLSFTFILRILGVVDRNLWKFLGCTFEFLNNTTNVIYTILRICIGKHR